MLSLHLLKKVLPALLLTAPVHASLVQYWTFDGNTTATVGDSGTLTGSFTAITSGAKSGQAVNLGSSSYLQASLAGTGTTYGSMTISFWERTQAGAWRDWTAVTSNGAASGEVRAEINAGDGTLDLYGITGSFATPATRLAWKSQLGGSTWSHVSLVFDGASSSIKVYTNGVLDGTLTGWTNSAAITAIRVNSSWTYTAGIDADYDDFAVFNTALSASDITNLYNGLSPTAVPEPSTYGLIGAGAIVGVVARRRRRA